MSDIRVTRRLVKSPPELWAEVSDPESLSRRLSDLGDIRITRTEPETTVAWEGEHARGTVDIEGSGWGTAVTITARPTQPPTPAPPPETPEPVPETREPVSERTEPASDRTDPIVERSEPVVERTEPVIEPGAERTAPGPAPAAER